MRAQSLTRVPHQFSGGRGVVCGCPHTSSAHLFSFERARTGAGPRYSNLAAVPWGSLLGSCAGTAAAARQLCVVCLCVVRAPMTPNTASGGAAHANRTAHSLFVRWVLGRALRSARLCSLLWQFIHQHTRKSVQLHFPNRRIVGRCYRSRAVCRHDLARSTTSAGC